MAKKYLYIAYISYCLLLVFSLHFHEMWRDELHSWAIASHSSTISDLLQNMRYDGHPALWYLVLFFASKISTYVCTPQVINIAISMAAIWIFIKKSTFTDTTKILFMFGYFPLFEYGIKARSYTLGILLIFVFAAILQSNIEQKRRYIYLILLLFLIAQTSAMGYIASIWLGAYMIFSVSRSLKYFLVRFIPYATLLSLSVLYVLPTRDNEYSHRIWTSATLLSNGSVMSFGLVDNIGISFIIFLICLYIIKKRSTKVMYFFAVVSYYLFFVFVYPGYLWHSGNLFIIFITLLWLDEPKAKTKQQGNSYKSQLLTGILIVLLIVGCIQTISDIRYPYSLAKATAEYIQSKRWVSMDIVGNPAYLTEPVGEFLYKPLYYPKSNDHEYFIRWTSVKNYITKTEMDSYVKNRKNTGKPFIVVTTIKLEPEYSSDLNRSFTDIAMVADEKYYVYLIN